MKYDVVGLGELLIDFAPMGDKLFQANTGGAPPNVLSALARQGHKTALLAMVGKDGFGEMLKQDMSSIGVDVSGVRVTDKASTTLAFVHLDDKGDRSFTFVRKPGADMLYSVEDIDRDMIDNCKIFHFGGVTITDSPSREATFEAARYAREQGKVVSYDPNLRERLWKSIEEAKKVLSQGFQYSDIVKLSEEEVEFLLDTTDLEEGSKKLIEMGASIVFITLGPKGCFYAHNDNTGTMPTYSVKVVDTTGAGDAFTGGALSYMLENGISKGKIFTKEQMEEIVKRGNATGSFATTKKSGIWSMPTPDEVKECMKLDFEK